MRTNTSNPHIILKLRDHGFVGRDKKVIIHKANHCGLEGGMHNGRENSLLEFSKVQVAQRKGKNRTLRDSSCLLEELVVEMDKQRRKVPTNCFDH